MQPYMAPVTRISLQPTVFSICTEGEHSHFLSCEHHPDTLIGPIIISELKYTEIEFWYLYTVWYG